MCKQVRDHAAVVFVDSPEGTPLVLDPKHPSPKWKLPGGTREEDESPRKTACRELKEETGLKIDPDELTLIKTICFPTHDHYTFSASLPNLRGLKKHGNEGEEVWPFSRDELLHVLLDLHRKILVEQGLLLSSRAPVLSTRT